ncbi:helix-turn-helix transcriptional regulator [Leptolyngbya sp. FACHB-17]|uniref:helix-turn-helix domain-containing protein n=1 Tax=unclassified Leptolyngbya TaxID=2650499 RepID=UPI001680588E|nr:helix-turn-helix transcriptional regulator [Leptolyngbya sp. FACHB-17]MBD2081739.1 helix-turn-helix transcriptional regulator [Leptolyngbya sp. FACHB-17]
MSRAGSALRQVLESHSITQYQLSAMMGVNRSNFSRWLRGERDPLAEVVVEIYKALKSVNPKAASEFIRLYLEVAPDEEV